MKHTLLFILLVCTATNSYTAEDGQFQGLSEKQVKASYAVLAGTCFLAGYLFNDIPIFSTDSRDFSNALGIFMLLHAFRYKHKPHVAPVNVIITPVYDSVQLSVHAALPLLLSHLGASHPPLIGSSAVWRRIGKWCQPKEETPNNWLWTGIGFGASQISHLVYDPVYTNEQQMRLCAQGREQLQLPEFQHYLTQHTDDTIQVRFPDWRLLVHYEHTSNDPLLQNSPVEVRTQPGEVTVTITTATARNSRFFDELDDAQVKAISAFKKRNTAIHRVTLNAVGRIVAQAPVTFSLFGNEAPLTRFAFGAVCSEVVDALRERFVAPHVCKREPDPLIPYKPLLPERSADQSLPKNSADQSLQEVD